MRSCLNSWRSSRLIFLQQGTTKFMPVFQIPDNVWYFMHFDVTIHIQCKFCSVSLPGCSPFYNIRIPTGYRHLLRSVNGSYDRYGKWNTERRMFVLHWGRCKNRWIWSALEAVAWQKILQTKVYLPRFTSHAKVVCLLFDSYVRRKNL